jgi:site-specific recombinase XerD
MARPSSSEPLIEHLLNYFRHWLQQPKTKKKSLTQKTLRNYLSDIRRFLKHLHRSQPLNLARLTSKSFVDYKSHLLQTKTPHSTLNRHLSSLRRFGLFLAETYQLKNPAAGLANLPQNPLDNLIKNFRYHLKKKGYKSKTINNYLSDVKHYLAWSTKTVS